MEKFVHRENLKLYRKLLAETTDAQKRQTLLKLLADEEAKDAPPSEKSRASAGIEGAINGPAYRPCRDPPRSCLRSRISAALHRTTV